MSIKPIARAWIIAHSKGKPFFMAKKQEAQVNLLELKPKRNLQWEHEGNDIVVLLVPKFRKGLLATWLQPKLPKPYIKVKLDEIGSYFWNLCDGNTTVLDISEKMKTKFGEEFDPKYERVGKFVTQLSHDKFLTFDLSVTG
ncbi:MAG: PqqD family protein [Bacteroidetes bacterium]|nr:MAG: PqqD family protein [Bacteroidota bacterium]